MLKESNFKAKTKPFYFFLTLSVLIFLWVISVLDLGKIFDTEKQELQSFASSFSTPSQLFDKGDSPSFGHLSSEDIPSFLLNLSRSLLDRILVKENSNLNEIKIFIKFKNLEKILNDRETALIKDINNGSKNVPCKVSDGINVYKCSVKLKGNRSDHWTSVKRMSLRIKVKGGFIHGMKEFAIQKPGSRQFPYDSTFHNLNNKFGGLSAIGQEFYKTTLNGESWGVMNVEPVIDEKFLQIQEVKRMGIFRISDENRSTYFRRWNDGRYLDYFISDPSVTLNIRGKDSEILKDPILNEVISHVHLSMSNGNASIFDRQALISNFALALAWGNIHTLAPRNMWFTWNAYEQHLEPILTDQGHWQDTENYFNNLQDIPYVYKMLFRYEPLKKEELLEELKNLYSLFKTNDPIQNVNSLKEKYFQNDQKFTMTPIFTNLSFLNQNISQVEQKINLLATQVDKDVPQKKITSDQLKKIDKVSEISHFTDGKIRIFNLLGDEIRVDSIFANGEEININKVIPSSKNESISYIDIKTDLIGSYEADTILIKFIINGIEKINMNTYSLNNINYELNSPITAENFCNYDELTGDCKLKGVLDFEQSIIFESRTIIEPGTKITLKQGGNLIFNSSVFMKGTKQEPINIIGNATGGIYIKNKKEQISTIQNSNFYNLSTFNSLLKRYTGSINGYGGTFNLKDIFITNGKAEDQLNIVNAKVNISGLKISNAVSDAFDCDFCDGIIKDINLSNVGGDGLDISGSNLKILDMKAKNIVDKAFSVGEKSFAVIDGAIFNTIATGIAVKDSSMVKASNITLINVEYDSFMTYVKKPFYKGNTKLDVREYNIDRNSESSLCIRESGTDLLLDNKSCDVSEVDIDELYKGRMKK